MVAGYVGDVLNPVPVNPVGNLRFPNPLGIESLAHAISTVLVGVGYVTVLASAACFVGLVRRYRGSGRELREQVKWLAFAAAGAGACILVALASLFACHCDQSVLATAMFVLFTAIIAFGMPGAIAVAVLKYRLFEIDVIISKAALYAILAAVLTGVYGAIVIGIGTVVGSRGSPLLTATAAVAIAVAFQPVRERARRLANRLVYGERATPYEVLTEFSDRVGGAYSNEDVLPRMAQILQSGTGAATARVWLRLGGELTAAASWPENGTATSMHVVGDGAAGFPPGEHGVEVRHQGEVLGALSVSMPPSDPMDSTKAKLVSDLAAQAGLVFRNVRLIEELRASRRRIVTSQDARAKALERNIHDGAQQQLVAMAVKLRLAEQLTERDAAKARDMLSGLQDEMRDALENLRDLARGIYPPLLADKGLVAALDAQARKGAVPTRVEADVIGRYPPEVEGAVYFCCLEALQNVAKYAGASRVSLRLTAADGELRFTVEDDGRGFDTASTGYGTGLQGMADRLDAIGGVLQVRSELGAGTTITGRIPAHFSQSVASI
jgi:signal transduction histidine kinase